MKRATTRSENQRVQGATRWQRAAVTAALAVLLAPAGAAGLGEIYDLARASDAQFAAAKAAVAAGREKVAQGRAGLLPTITLAGNWRKAHDRSNDSNIIGSGSADDLTVVRNYDSNSMSMNVTQPLLRRVNVETYAQAELQALLAEQQLKVAEQELLLRVSRGYFEVLQAQDALGSVTAQKGAFAQQLAQARRSFEVGLAPITDVNEAQSRHDLTVAQEIAARNDLELKRRTLEKSIDQDLPALDLLDDQAAIDLIGEGHLKALVERAPDDSLQVALGLTAEQIARREVSRQDAAHLPTIDLVLNYNENRNGTFGTTGRPSTLRSSSIGVDISFGVYQGGVVLSRSREAVANLERARQELLNARRQARLDSRQAYLGVQSGSALHVALRQALSSSETQVRSTRRGFEVGVRTRVDVLNAEQQLYATKKDLAASRYQTLVAGLQLKAAAGVLTEFDLRGLDRLLKPQ